MLCRSHDGAIKWLQLELYFFTESAQKALNIFKSQITSVFRHFQKVALSHTRLPSQEEVVVAGRPPPPTSVFCSAVISNNRKT